MFQCVAVPLSESELGWIANNIGAYKFNTSIVFSRNCRIICRRWMWNTFSRNWLFFSSWLIFCSSSKTINPYMKAMCQWSTNATTRKWQSIFDEPLLWLSLQFNFIKSFCWCLGWLTFIFWILYAIPQTWWMGWPYNLTSSSWQGRVLFVQTAISLFSITILLANHDIFFLNISAWKYH